MTIGLNWLRQAERAAEAKAGEMMRAAERRLRELLPEARIERVGTELRISARKLVGRWITEPALRFLKWTLK